MSSLQHFSRNANTQSYQKSLRRGQRELGYNIHEQLSIVDHGIPSLNSELNIFTTIMSAVNSPKQCTKVFFIDRPGGTDKTFLYNTLLAQVRSQSQISLGLASSGIEARLPGGRTVQSRLKVPVNINELSVCNNSKQSSLAQLIKRTNLLVWMKPVYPISMELSVLIAV